MSEATAERAYLPAPDSDEPLPQVALDTLAWINGKDAALEEAERELLDFERRVQTAAGQIQAWATENTERAARARDEHERASLLEIAGAYEHAARFLRETFPRRRP